MVIRRWRRIKSLLAAGSPICDSAWDRHHPLVRAQWPDPIRERALYVSQSERGRGAEGSRLHHRAGNERRPSVSDSLVLPQLLAQRWQWVKREWEELYPSAYQPIRRSGGGTTHIRRYRHVTSRSSTIRSADLAQISGRSLRNHGEIASAWSSRIPFYLPGLYMRTSRMDRQMLRVKMCRTQREPRIAISSGVSPLASTRSVGRWCHA